MNQQRSTVLCALALGASVLAACGGRYQISGDDTLIAGSGAPSAGRFGTEPSHGGASSAGATNGTGATAGGAATNGVGSTAGARATGVAGATSSAGAGAVGCDAIACPIITCPAGSEPIAVPGACCATSCYACDCPKLACTIGTHIETRPGVCCPSCVDDADALCRKGQQAYAVQREAMLSKYQLGCASDAECVTIAPVNACEQGCAYAALWYGASDSFEANLSSAAASYCSSCKQGPIPPCAPPSVPRCINASCQFAPK